MIGKMGAIRLGLVAATLGAMLIEVCHGDDGAIRTGMTYYVSPDGNDVAAGAEKTPLRTLQVAASLARPGDTIIARPGEYAGFVLGWDIRQGGQAGRPITYIGQPGAVIVSRNNKTPDGIDLEPGSDYVVIQGFTIKNPSDTIRRAGIRITGSIYVSVIGNIVQGADTWGIFTSHTNDVLIENNTVSRSQREHGIYVSNSVDYPVVRCNTVFDNHMCGIHLNGDASQGGNGLITNALIENNIIHDNGIGGGSAINCDGMENSIIRRNLLYGNHGSGISLYRRDAAAGSRGNFVVNNTIVMAATARYALNINTGSTGNVICNNVLLNPDPRTGSIKVDSNSRDGLASDYNIVEDRFSLDEDGDWDLSDWQSTTGQDKHSRVASATQLFVNLAGHDFHLSPSGPAVHAGTMAFLGRTAPSVDLEGNPFGANRDIGAYESARRRAH
jgi:parallel beta-helix repeat protein